MSARPPPDALIFDVDGTLAETEEAHRLAFEAAFMAAGLPWRWDPPLYARLLEVAGGKERIRHFVDAHGALPRLDDEAIARLHAAKTRRYVDAVACGEVALRPGIARLLAEARREGVRLAIATTTSRANVEGLLAAAMAPDAVGWFEVVAAADSVGPKKPAPDVYEFVLDGLGLPPERCVAFEDSPNGLRAASAAGLPCVVTPSAHLPPAPDFTGALAVVDSLGEPGEPGRCVDLALLREWLRDVD